MIYNNLNNTNNHTILNNNHNNIHILLKQYYTHAY